MTPPNYPINLIPRQDFRKEKEAKEEPLIWSIYYNPGPRRHSDQIRDFTATETRRERPIHHPFLSI